VLVERVRHCKAFATATVCCSNGTSSSSSAAGTLFRVRASGFSLALGILLAVTLASFPAAYGQSSAAQISSPTPSTVLTGSSATFTWSAVSSATAYWVYVGTTGPKSANIYSSGSTTATSVTVTGIPTYGVNLYVTLFSLISGTWTPVEYTYTEAGTPVLATMVSPTPSSTLTGASVTFSWTPGGGPTGYWLDVGTTGPGSANLYDAGGASSTSATVTGLPTNGNPVYVTLYSEISGVWQPVRYVYTAQVTGPATQAAMITPVSGSVLAGSTVTFSWTAGSSVSGYWLNVGTTAAGSSNVYDSGALTSTAVTLSNIPTTGQNLYVTLLSQISGTWQATNYVYTEAGSLSPAAMTSPAPGSTLLGTSATFTWSTGSGPTAYWINVGTTGAGSYNVYDSGALTTTSATVTGIPTNGAPLYVTLFSRINGAYQAVQYTYTEASPPAPATMKSPTAGSVLSGSSTTFSWNPGSQVTAYWLNIGTTGAGSYNLYDSGALSGTSVTVSGIPANGVTLYVTLLSRIAGAYQAVSYTYTESGSPVAAAMTSPTPGSTLPGAIQTFTWSQGGGPTAYWLNIGSTGAGSYNIFDSGSLTGTSVTVSNLPTNSSTIYVTLFSQMNGVWQPTNYTYTASNGASYQVELSWSAPTGSSVQIGGYDVFRANSGSTNYELLNASVDTGTSYVDNSVTAGASYNYYIESVSSAGVPSNPSNIYSVTIP